MDRNGWNRLPWQMPCLWLSMSLRVPLIGPSARIKPSVADGKKPRRDKLWSTYQATLIVRIYRAQVYELILRSLLLQGT